MTEDSGLYPRTGRFLEGRLRHAMTASEKDQLEALCATEELFEGAHTVLRRGEVSERSTILVEGYVIRTIEEDGQRHIVGLNVPGDFVDLHSFALKRLDHDVVTLGRTRLAYVEHAKLETVMAKSPHLARLLWFATLLDAAIHREWILKLGQLRADGRVAHLFAETQARLELVGLGRRDGFVSPLNQSHLAEICGTSVVHMNRSLRNLREAQIAEFRRGRVYVLDRKRLAQAGRFESTYLYGEGELRVRRNLDAA